MTLRPLPQTPMKISEYMAVVRRGQPVGTLYADQFQQAVHQAEARIENQIQVRLAATTGTSTGKKKIVR